MKKTITITMIVILLFNLISINSFAESDGNFEMNKPMSSSPQETGNVGIVNEDGQSIQASITGTEYSGGTIFKIVANVFTVIPQIINQALESFVEVTTESKMKRFTIYDTVTGKIDLFNINYMDIPEKIDDDSSLIDTIKFHVINFYYILRNLSIALSVLVLIYIGIRMAISTVASDKAKYKKMLINWLAALVLVFIMHFIVIIISFILQLGLSTVNKIAEVWGVSEFETQIYSGAINNLTAKGFNFFYVFVTVHLLTWYQVKFFMYYMRRTLEVNFLIIVSPIVTITYPIDKIGDSKAQAFQMFLKELILKSAMQLVHAISYVVFIATAGVIASNQPLLAILFFMALSRSEKIVKKIFTLNDDGIQREKIPLIEK